MTLFKKFSRIIDKLNAKSNERISAILEALSAAWYKKKGYEVELEPTVEKSRIADFRVRFGNEWIYFECKKEYPQEMECPNHCVESVLQIRQFLTSKISETPENTELSTSLRAMRAACRKFLNETNDPHEDTIRYGFQMGHDASWKFISVLGELRGVFGIYIAKIAVAYGIDIEKDLTSKIPGEDID